MKTISQLLDQAIQEADNLSTKVDIVTSIVKSIEQDRKNIIRRLREMNEEKTRFAADVLQNEWFDFGIKQKTPEISIKEKPITYVSDILGKLIEANFALQNLSSSWKDSISAYGYAKDYKTIRVNLGRQTGKTTAIKKFCGYGDIVLAHNNRWKKELQIILPKGQVSVYTFEDIQHPRFMLSNKTNYKVWVDETSQWKQEELDSIYTLFASRATQFILLG